MLINDRDRAYTQKKWSKYHRLREDVIQQIRYLKSQQIAKAVNSGNVRNLWSVVKEMGRHSSVVSSSSTNISPDDFSAYFCSLFQEQRLSPSEIQMSDLRDTTIPTITALDIEPLLRGLKRKSAGPDELPSFVFREYFDVLAPAIAKLFNMSIESGCVPLCFKRANVVPVPKCTRPRVVSDYRQISLLPILSKVLEKVVLHFLILPLIKNKINGSQFAFIPGISSGTVSALTLMSNRILQFLDTSSGAVRILALDFAKAFDKCMHNVILSAATNFGLPYIVLKWISSFLNDRVQRVRWNGEYSNWKSVTSGVPQGSVIGPTLFAMVVDDLEALSPNSLILKYADDVTILHFIRNASDDRLQQEWDHCLSWSEANHLPLNISKCKTMEIVTGKSVTIDPVIVQQGVLLPQVEELKVLGLTFSSTMRWNAHISNIISTASRRIYLIRNLKLCDCPPELIFRAYVAFIRSLILYAYPAFCNLTLYLQKYLVLIEKRILRIIGREMNQSRLFTVADASCRKLFRKIEKDVNHPLRIIFEERPCPNVMTRNRCSLKCPRAKTKRFGESFIKFCAAHNM